MQSGDGISFVKKFAKFGDLDRVRDLSGRGMGFTTFPNKQLKPRGRPKKQPVMPDMSELIHFRRPNSFSRWYGYTDWLAAVQPIELTQCASQHQYDFFLNRGVPELLISVEGYKVPKPDWDAFLGEMKNHIGLKKSHKTQAINFAGSKDARVVVHKLAMEGQTDGLFTQLAEVLSSAIVSAHGCPPLLAGIQIPGKLGASNELANALMAFQALRIGPSQHLFESTLIVTLGSEFPEIKEEEWKFRTILEDLDIAQVATVGGMKQPLNQAKAEGRDLGAGMKD